MAAVTPSGSPYPPTPQSSTPNTQPDPASLPVSPEVTNQVPNTPISDVVKNFQSHPGQPLAAFIDDAHAAGYKSIDPNVIATIGYQNGNTNQSKLSLATLAAASAMPNKISQYLYEQSAMSPIQSLSKSIQDHVTNTGIQTTPPASISVLQQQLIDDGFAPSGTKANGVWSNDWNNASYKWSQFQFNKLSPGSFSAVGAFNTIFGQSWLSHALNLVGSVADAAAAGVLKGFGSAYKGVVDLGAPIQNMLGTPNKPSDFTPALWADSGARLLQHQKAQTLDQYAKTPFGNQDVLNLLNGALSISALGTVSKLGFAGATAIKEGIAAGTEAGATNAAKALVTDIGPQAPKGITNTIMNSVLPETATGTRFFGTRWLHNVPAAQGLVNGLDKVAGGVLKGYQTIRSAAATPYRLPIVGIGGQLIQDTSIAGIKLGLQGHTENWIGDPNGPQAFALNHLKPIAGIAGDALNIVQLAAHGPSYSEGGLPSQAVGAVAQDIHAKFADAANSSGILSGYERGTAANVLKEQQQLADAKLNPDLRFNQISSKFMDLAARHAGQDIVNNAIDKGVLDGSNADQRLRFLQNAQSVIRNDPNKLNEAMQSYYAKPQAWESDLQREMSLSKEDPTSAFNHGIVNLTKAQEIFRNNFLPKLSDLKTPDSGIPQDTSWMSQGLNDGVKTDNTHYRETSPDGLTDLLSGNQNSANPTWFSKDKDLALGQGNNKGVLIHFDRDAHLASNSKTSKIDYRNKNKDAMSITGDSSERQLLVSPNDVLSHTNKIDFSPEAWAYQNRKSDFLSNPAVGEVRYSKQIIQTLENAGFKMQQNADGGVSFIKESQNSSNGIRANGNSGPLSQGQLNQIQKLMKSNGITERDARLKYMSKFLNKNVGSTNELTNGEAGQVINSLKPKVTTIADAQRASLADQPISSKFGLSRIESLHAPDAQRLAMGYYQELEKAKPGFVAPKTLDDLPPSSGKDFGANSPPSAIPKTFGKQFATTDEIALRKEVMGTLGNELGRNIEGLTNVPTQDLIKLIVEKSHWLPTDVGLPADGSLNAVNDALRATGYKLNYGTDVGHQWTDPMLPKEMLGSPRNVMQMGMDKLGLNLAQVEPKYKASAGISAAQSVLQDGIVKLQAKGSILPDWVTGSRLISKLQDIIQPQVGYLSHAYMELASNPVIGKAVTLRPSIGSAWGKQIKEIINTTQKDINGNPVIIKNRQDAVHYLESKLASFNTPQTWTKSDWMNALTNKGIVDGRPAVEGETGIITNNKGQEVDAIGMSVSDANKLWYDFQKGLRSTPHYAGGINPFSRLMNSSFGLANVPLDINGHRILALTSKIQPALLNAKYNISPMQSWLRADKSAIKGLNIDMPLSLNPKASLDELGPQVAQDAYNLTDKLFGKDKQAEDVAAEFSAAEVSGHTDLSNIYNPRATLARTVHYAAQKMIAEGKDISTPAGEAELKNSVNAVNNYGNRTAAEQTVNAFFFPFSFEKTVIRELGSALLDSPSLRMMTAAAITAYNSSDGQKTKTWMEQNLPLFKEAERFNPFYHGVGAGRPGGINFPFFTVAENLLYGKGATSQNPLDGVTAADKLDLFVKMLMPKPITTKDSAIAALALIPAFKDLATNVIGYNPGLNGPQGPGQSALAISAKTLAWEAGSELSKLVHGQITGPSNTDSWASQGHLPYQVQQNEAWQLISQIVTGYTSTLYANEHGGNYGFPTGFPTNFQGQKLNMNNIRLLVHQVYPAFDPSKIFQIIGAKATAVSDQRAIISTKVPEMMNTYNQFVKYSNQVQSYISKNLFAPDFDSSKLVAPMNYLRGLAGTLDAKDPTFGAFYAKYYATKYGPLKGL